MRKLMTLVICMVFVICTNAQKAKDETPAAAKAAFVAKYPTATKAKWSLEKPGEFEVDFILNKLETSAVFDAAGKFLESEVEVKEAELPQAVKATLAKDFAGYKLGEIAKATDAKGVVDFEMELAKGKDKLSISIDSNGKVLSKEAAKEEKDEKGEKEEKEVKKK